MAENYVAVADLKIGSKKDDDFDKDEYIRRGESVSEGDVEDFDLLVKSGSVVTEEQYKAMFPEVQQGSNQADGTPSNLEQIEGSILQVNPPEEGEEVPETRVPAVNPSDVTPVEGAKDPTDDTSDVDEEDLKDDDEEDGDTTPFS